MLGLLPRSHPSSGGQNWCPICHSQPKSIQRGYQFWIRGLHDQAALWASATWSTDMYCNVHASVEIVSLMLCPSRKDKSVIRHHFPGWVRCNESCTSFSEQAHIWRSSYLAHPQNFSSCYLSQHSFRTIVFIDIIIQTGWRLLIFHK